MKGSSRSFGARVEMACVERNWSEAGRAWRKVPPMVEATKPEVRRQVLEALGLDREASKSSQLNSGER